MFIDTIGFDADDTLWHNESLYAATQERFRDLLAAYCSPQRIDLVLYKTEMRNLHRFGYGIKGFTLSMIEAAIELTEGKIEGWQIQAMLDYANDMLLAPVELLPGVQEVIGQIAGDYSLFLITKGDLFDQEKKIGRSGLADCFDHVEIVSEKSAKTYAELLAKLAIPPDRFLMVGNSLRSDVLPVLEIGGAAVHVPYQITWQHEDVNLQPNSDGAFMRLTTIHQLPDLLAQLAAG